MGSSKAYWYVQDHIVFVHNVGDLTADDFRGVDKQIIAFMRERYEKDHDAKVHVLVDSIDMRKLPRITELEGGRILGYMKEPNCGWTVVVGYRDNPFLKILSRLLTSIMNVDLYMSDTMSKALSFFRQIEPDIENLPDVTQWKQDVTSSELTD